MKNFGWMPEEIRSEPEWSVVKIHARFNLLWIRLIRIMVAVAMIIAIVLVLCGIKRDLTVLNIRQDESSSGFQELYDRARAAKEYALHAMQAQGVEENAITATNYGFAADNSTTFLITFTFKSGSGERAYGYRIEVNNDHNCTIVEESQALGMNLISIGEETENTAV